MSADRQRQNRQPEKGPQSIQGFRGEGEVKGASKLSGLKIQWSPKLDQAETPIGVTTAQAELLGADVADDVRTNESIRPMGRRGRRPQAIEDRWKGGRQREGDGKGCGWHRCAVVMIRTAA